MSLLHKKYLTSSYITKHARIYATTHQLPFKFYRNDQFYARNVSISALQQIKDTKESIEMIHSIDQISSNTLRNIITMPEEMLNRLTSIVKQRTNSQLQHLKEKYIINKKETNIIPQSHQEEFLGWTLDKAIQVPTKMYGTKETLAYLAYEMDAYYASTYHVFQALKQVYPEFQPSSILDFGAGPGTASWVANTFYNTCLNKYRLVEPSQSMIDASNILCEGFPGLSIRNGLSEMKQEIINGIKYDFIVVNFVLTEIPSDYERVTIMTALWELLNENGCIMIIDKGSPWGSYQVRSARQYLLDSTRNEENTEENEYVAKVLAPCTHQFECPMKKGTWCHFAQRAGGVKLPREASAKRWGNHFVSKFSYAIIEKAKADSLETRNSRLARLVRPPIVNRRHVLLDLCSPIGELERRPVTKGKHIREVYRASRSSHWGALWPADASIYTEKIE